MKKFVLPEEKLRVVIGILQELKWREVARAMMELGNLEEVKENSTETDAKKSTRGRKKKEVPDVGSTKESN